jgi:cardiolipin synthase
VQALTAAVQRGVTVRVIVDAMGERYSSVTARAALKGSGVDIRHYLPLYKGPFINLRNHRKLLVVDGALAFTGGMNIRSNHCVVTAGPLHATSDLHFQVRGPVVGDLQRIFVEDWYFVSSERLDDPRYFPVLAPCGTALARAIADGPDREFRKLEWIVMGALSTAKQRVCIMTPYFIPDRPMVTALITAALRGVQITLILPQRNNLPFVAWASRATYWELIKNGIHILEQPPPFAHTKLMLVDEIWTLIGSANLDTRSFRLNFELNLAVYDRGVTANLNRHFEGVLAVSHTMTLQEMDARPLPIKLRDGAARLFSPYL